MTHTLDDFEYVLRDDEAQDSISVSDALRNAGAIDGNEIEVPKVVD